MKLKLKRPTLRALVPWAAQLALFALLFQITALDHDLNLAEDETNPAAHATHCHIGANCADGGGMVAVAVPSLPRLATPDPITLDAHLDFDAPVEPFLGVPFEPPQV